MSEPEKSPQQELDEIAQRRAARRRQYTDGQLLELELERARVIDAAEEKYGVVDDGIAVIAVSDAPDAPIVIVKRPPMATFRKYQDSKANASEAASAFVRPCVVHPAQDAYDRLLNEYPALLTRLTKACAKLAGYRDDEKL